MIRSLGELFQALSDPTRRRVLDLLRDGPRTTGALAARFPRLSRFAVMKHLGVLEEVGLVLVRREGRMRWNYLNAVPLRRAYDRWVGRFASDSAGSMLQLAAVAEAEQANEKGGIVMPQQQQTEKFPAGRTAKIEQEIHIAAARGIVWKVMTEQPNRWWTKRFNQDSTVQIEPKPGGRFWEEYSPDSGGGGALYATITQIKPNEKLVMIGPMGMRLSVHNLMTLILEDRTGGGTTVKLSHHASGDVTDDVISGYSDGWTELLGGNLKDLAESIA